MRRFASSLRWLNVDRAQPNNPSQRPASRFLAAPIALLTSRRLITELELEDRKCIDQGADAELQVSPAMRHVVCSA